MAFLVPPPTNLPLSTVWSQLFHSPHVQNSLNPPSTPQSLFFNYGTWLKSSVTSSSFVDASEDTWMQLHLIQRFQNEKDTANIQ